MQELVFTDEEMRTQLEAIGFDNVSDEQLRFFRRDLERLLRDESKSTVTPASSNSDYDRFRCDSSRSSSRSCVLIEKVKVPPRFISSAENAVVLAPEMNRSEVLNDEQAFDSESFTKPRKRKVLRRKNGQSIIYDETDGTATVNTSPSSHFLNVVQTSKRPSLRHWSSMGDIRDVHKPIYRTKSVILPYKNKTRPTCLKTDPVALFQYYKRQWDTHKVPGEKDHKDLRWNIRTMMSYRSYPNGSANV